MRQADFCAPTLSAIADTPGMDRGSAFDIATLPTPVALDCIDLRTFENKERNMGKG